MAEDDPPPHEVINAKEVGLSLPKRKIGTTEYSFYQGFWCRTYLVENVISFQRHFQAHDSDIIVASKPKSGTTWLKALVFSIINRDRYTPSNTPLLTQNPHQLVPFFELQVYDQNQCPEPDLTTIPSPRLFSTHIPYASLPDSIKHSNCRMVYICRNPLDVVVSLWHMIIPDKPEAEAQQGSMEEFVDAFCSGTEGFGPFWEHVLGYHKESLEKPNKVLFFMYEDLRKDFATHLKKLAEFLGRPFSLEEEKRGVVEDISNLCSLSNLKELEVNKSGRYNNLFANKLFFRKGEVGDWVNYLTPCMAERLDKTMKEKFSPSGLTFRFNSSC